MEDILKTVVENMKKFGAKEEFISNPYFTTGFYYETANNFSGETLSSINVNEEQKKVTVKMQSGTEYTYTCKDSSSITVSKVEPVVENQNENVERTAADFMEVKFYDNYKTIVSTTTSKRVTRYGKNTADVSVIAGADSYERLYGENGLELRCRTIEKERVYKKPKSNDTFLNLSMQELLYGAITNDELSYSNPNLKNSYGSSVKIESIERTSADLCSHMLYYASNGVVKHDYKHDVVPLALDHLHILPYACRERMGEYTPVNENTRSTEDVTNYIKNASTTEVPEELKPGLLNMVNGRDAIIAEELQKQKNNGMRM